MGSKTGQGGVLRNFVDSAKIGILALTGIVLLALPVKAQETAPSLPDRIIKPMYVMDSVTLRADAVDVTLWGIEPALTSETPLELNAIYLLDELTQGLEVNCKVVGGRADHVLARCTGLEDRDLALELLSNGYAVVDRRVVFNTPFADGYEKAEQQARTEVKGVWRVIADRQASYQSPWLQPYIGSIMFFMMVFGPFAGMVIVGLVMWIWFRRIAEERQREFQDMRSSETLLRAREQRVLASTLEGELIENKNKIEAFMVIYGDMLEDLKKNKDTPKYQQAGDIIQKHPGYSKTVFEANVDKLSMLDIKIAGKLSKLYAALPSAQEYIELEPSVSLETAKLLIAKVMEDAKSMIEPIDQVIADLRAHSHDTR